MTAEPAARPIPEALRHLYGSLAAEEQFYLVLPAILIVLLRVRLRSALILVAGAVGLTLARQLDLYLEGASRGTDSEFGIDTRNHLDPGRMPARSLLSLTEVLPRLAQSRWAGARRSGLRCFALFLTHLDRALFLGPPLLFLTCCALLIVRALDDLSLVSRILVARSSGFRRSNLIWPLPVALSRVRRFRRQPPEQPR